MTPISVTDYQNTTASVNKQLTRVCAFYTARDGSSILVADPAMGRPGGPPTDQNLGLVMAAQLRHGANFHLNP